MFAKSAKTLHAQLQAWALDSMAGSSYRERTAGQSWITSPLCL